jgi:hypothetical protein
MILPLHPKENTAALLALVATELAAVIVKDFEGLGFRKVWNPIELTKH